MVVDGKSPLLVWQLMLRSAIRILLQPLIGKVGSLLQVIPLLQLVKPLLMMMVLLQRRPLISTNISQVNSLLIEKMGILVMFMTRFKPAIIGIQSIIKNLLMHLNLLMIPLLLVRIQLIGSQVQTIPLLILMVIPLLGKLQRFIGKVTVHRMTLKLRVIGIFMNIQLVYTMLTIPIMPIWRWKLNGTQVQVNIIGKTITLPLRHPNPV